MKAARLTQPNSTSGPSREGVGEMFDRISPRYDLLNRLLSLRRDVAWRKRLANHLPKTSGKLELLDLACGTADVMLTLKAISGRVGSVVGLDLSRGMLAIGAKKIAQHGLRDDLSVAQGDASVLPFPDNSFDGVTIAFGIRNLAALDQALSEIRRVLRPGGRFLILEFSLPRNALLRGFYLVYFRHILPRLGGLISGDREAYRYLDQTVETFPYGAEMVRILQAAGFVDVKLHPQTFGIASIYQADEPTGSKSDEGKGS
jgi:demethylmenaquinone methyltransferase/2-methoxy-6-polyprenyl-1,4-benzoquinol methylase